MSEWVSEWGWERLPKEPEPVNLGFTYWVIRIILAKKSWPKQDFIDEAANTNNKRLA